MTTADLRRLSTAELEQLGQDSLREHLLAQAVVAHQKYAPLTADKLAALLHDADCLRHPVRLIYEFGEMAMHQFAQPELDWRNTEQDGRVLYLRPMLRDHPDLVVLAVAYMIPAINYGDVITGDHCILYGATLLGMMEEEFYGRLCALADFVGAETRLAGATGSEPAAPEQVGRGSHGECGLHGEAPDIAAFPDSSHQTPRFETVGLVSSKLPPSPCGLVSLPVAAF